MKARPDFQQTGYPTPDAHAAGGWHNDFAQDLKHRGLARPVVANDTHTVALFNRETHVAQGPELLFRQRVLFVLPAEQLPEIRRNNVTQGVGPFPFLVVDNVLLTYIFDGNDGHETGSELVSWPVGSLISRSVDRYR